MYMNFQTGGFVYIIASKMAGTLYTGVTSDLIKRVSQHRAKEGSQFACKYDVYRLVYYREFDTMPDAIKFEKQLKKWQRAWKIQLIEENNPKWDDLFDQLIQI